MFLNCPACIDTDGAARCGLPAEVHYRYTMNSTDGPLESAKISCPLGHHFNGPIEYLTVPEQPTASAESASVPPPALGAAESAYTNRTQAQPAVPRSRRPGNAAPGRDPVATSVGRYVWSGD